MINSDHNLIYNSNYLIIKNVIVLSINPDDHELANFGIESLKIINKIGLNNIVIDLSLFEFITSEHITFIHQIVDVYKLNNISSIVCNFNIYSASILFHFIDDVQFQTALDIQSAIDVFENQ